MKDSIQKEIILEHSIDSIWSAITKAEEISTWFLKTDFKAEVGFKYTHSSDGEDCTQIIGEVKAVDPYTLVHTWQVSGTNVETTVTWNLEQTEAGTKLSLEHSGISNYDGDTAPVMFDSFSGGWDNCVHGLAEYLSQSVHA